MSSAPRRRVRFPCPGEAEVVEEEVRAPEHGEVQVRTVYSAISPGTERLVYEGNAPADFSADVSLEALSGQDLSFPLSYGYACAGVVETVGAEVDDSWLGARVFAFQPHVSRFTTSVDTLIPVPTSVDLEDAVLIPTVETAVNLVMDGRPMVGEGVLVFGQGVVGLLTTKLLGRHPLQEIVTVEPVQSRRQLSREVGATRVLESAPAEAPAFGMGEQQRRADLTFELTGRPEVLGDAVWATAFDGRVVVGSWYGEKEASIALGSHFHRSRIQIISSQVSTIAPCHAGRWTKDRRLQVVVNLLGELSPKDLISHRVDLDEAPGIYDRLASDTSVLQPVFVHHP